jgi:Zn-dependent peptidase ImmA (M78 family)
MKETKQMENEANQFAMAILMPESMLRAQIKRIDPKTDGDQVVRILANKFKVSAIKMTMRLSDLKLIE